MIREYTRDELVALLPFPAENANKYSRGTLWCVVGSAHYPGAACLAARASQRAGAGYTRVLTAPEAVDIVRLVSPSLVVQSWNEMNVSQLPSTVASRPLAYVVGSGFDAQDENAQHLTYAVLKHAHVPVLVDGGALGFLATKKGRSILKKRFVAGVPSIITPHAGEAARLARPLALSEDDEAVLAQRLALAYGVVCVLKGPVTFISDGEEIVRMAQGTPALAKAGTGDVLAGMIGALLSQGLAPIDAAVLGSTLHAKAAYVAQRRFTAISVCAEDVIEALPEAIALL